MCLELLADTVVMENWFKGPGGLTLPPASGNLQNIIYYALVKDIEKYFSHSDIVAFTIDQFRTF